MKFVKYDLGDLLGGVIVEVKLWGGPANVRLMDSANFELFRERQAHEYVGRRVTKAGVRLKVPHSGHWIVTVDLGGRAGTVRSSVRILPAPA